MSKKRYEQRKAEQKLVPIKQYFQKILISLEGENKK